MRVAEIVQCGEGAIDRTAPRDYLPLREAGRFGSVLRVCCGPGARCPASLRAGKEGSDDQETFFRWGFAPLALTFFIVSAAVQVGSGQQQNGGSVAIDNDDIGGVVTGAKGPEAGVWVIAETTNLPTRMIRIVVTDDQGRFVVPDLPKANYDVWVRGYGLVDSPKITVRARPDAEPESRACARTRRRPRSTTRRSTGSPCCRCRRRATSPAPARRATASRR